MDAQEAAQELLARREARKGLLPFTQYTHPKYAAGRPHTVIAEACDRLLFGDLDRVMFLAPPRHGKTELVSRRLPALALGHFPDWPIISGSSVQGLADDIGREVRDILASPDYGNLFDTRLAEDSQARGKWSTDQGGGYYAVGVGAAVMGRGGRLIIIDDPYATWEDAQSEATRNRVWQWYCNTIYNRQMDGVKICIINHRMHEDDLCGRLLEAEKAGGDKWHVVNLPAVSEGQALWPERYPIEVLDRIKAVMMQGNPIAWSALYMQDPTPEDGSYFKRAWFDGRRYTETPKGLNIYMTGDFAVSEGEGDYSAVLVWGVDHDGKVYVLDHWTAQVGSDKWTWQIVRMMQQWKPWAFAAEAGVIRKSVEPFLRDTMDRENVSTMLEWLPTTGDKPAMCRAFQGLQSCGRIYWPKVQWADEVIVRLLKFPGGSHDDDVDACGVFGRFITSVWDAQRPPAPETVPDWNAPIQLGQIMKRKRKPD